MEGTYNLFAEEKVRHNVTLFRKFTEIVKHVTIQDCIDEIRNGSYKKQVEEIRKTNTEKGKEEADKLKKNLLGFTASGVFKKNRRITDISEYNQCVILDFDDISADYLEEAKDRATLAAYTLAAFISPRGTGLKIIVKVNTELESHGLAFQKVADYYAQVLNEEVDPSGKDCSRLCFMSYDPEAYYNSDAEVFQISQEIAVPKETVLAKTHDEIFNGIVEFTNQKATYANGSRNNYIHLLACNCNRSGLSADFTQSRILMTFDLDAKEVEATVKGVYEHNVSDFGKYPNTPNVAGIADFAKSADLTTDSLSPDVLMSMPHIPDLVYENLPSILKKGAEAFEDEPRKRDVFLTCAITILSGCLPSVSGIYHQDRVYPNLFSFIIAPAANGKGVLKNAKRLADKYHNKLNEQSKAIRAEYEAELLRYKATCAKLKKDEEPPEKPEEPPFKRIFIPGNTSQAMVIKMINDNDGSGIICETEADTMAGAHKQDWGNYSPIMRSSFHHEKVSVARKTGNEVLEIQEPKISICLSGTPAQVPRLIGSAEDGLFSRFMFYAFRSPIEWKSPAPKENGIVFDDHFSTLSDEVLLMAEMLENYPTQVQLTKEQWQNFNREFGYLLQKTILFNTDDTAGVVYRLGLITFRICMLFTACRKFDDGDTSKIVCCSEQDFASAILLSKTYIDHSMLMFNNLSGEDHNIKYKPTGNKQKLIDLLPDTFQRKQAVEEGLKLSLKERTVDDLLSKLVPDLLEKIKDGLYKKIDIK